MILRWNFNIKVLLIKSMCNIIVRISYYLLQYYINNYDKFAEKRKYTIFATSQMSI